MIGKLISVAINQQQWILDFPCISENTGRNDSSLCSERVKGQELAITITAHYRMLFTTTSLTVTIQLSNRFFYISECSSAGLHICTQVNSVLVNNTSTHNVAEINKIQPQGETCIALC